MKKKVHTSNPNKIEEPPLDISNDKVKSEDDVGGGEKKEDELMTEEEGQSTVAQLESRLASLKKEALELGLADSPPRGRGGGRGSGRGTGRGGRGRGRVHTNVTLDNRTTMFKLSSATRISFFLIGSFIRHARGKSRRKSAQGSLFGTCLSPEFATMF